MRVMVVGGAGYIGSALVPVLVSPPNNHSVTVVDPFWFGDFLPPEAERWRMNALELAVEQLRGFDAVIFLAGLSTDPMAEFAPLENYVANAALPAFLAFAARTAGVRKFIHAGSCSTYGREHGLVTELASKPKSFSPYGVSKLMGEQGCLQQARDKLSVLSFRMGTVCGASPRMRFDLVVNAMVKDAFLTGAITVNDPTAERPVLDIRDAVDAYVKALEIDGSRDAVNLLSFNTTIIEIARAVQHAMNIEHNGPPRIDIESKRDVRSYSASKSYAESMGFETNRGLVDTVTSAIQGFKAVKDHTNGRYYNMQMFKHIMASEKTKRMPQVGAFG